MKAKCVLLRFLTASIAAFGTLLYFGFSYESLLLSFADQLIHGLNIGARIMHDSSHQLCIVIFLPGGPVQVKIAEFDWIYASQATAVGVVLSTCASPGRKAFWLTIVCAMLALAHTALLVLAVTEIIKHINGANGELTAYGTFTFKLYRNAMPALLASVWIICSRETLFPISSVRRSKPAPTPAKTTSKLRIRKDHSVAQQDLHLGFPDATALHWPRESDVGPPYVPRSALTPVQDKPPPEQGY